MGANFRWLSLGDLRGKWNLIIECPCRHAGTLDSGDLLRWYMCHGWPTARAQIAHHLKCGACQRRGRYGGFVLGITAGDPTSNPFPKNEAGWTMLVRRLRNH